jgi:hypothetical protein
VAYGLANQAPGGAPVYWLGPDYPISDRTTVLKRSSEVAGGIAGQYARILQGTTVHGEGVNVLIITRLPRPTRPPPPVFDEHARLLFAVTFADSSRADVYVAYESAPRFDDELRAQLRPDIHQVPRISDADLP